MAESKREQETQDQKGGNIDKSMLTEFERHLVNANPQTKQEIAKVLFNNAAGRGESLEPYRSSMEEAWGKKP